MLKSELEKVLLAVKPGLAKRKVDEDSAKFLFTDDYVATCSGNLFVYYPKGFGVNCLVDSSDMLSTVKAISENEIKMEVKKDKLHISSKTTKAKLNAYIGDNTITKFINKMDVSTLDFEELPKGFKTGFELCSFSYMKTDCTNRFYNVFCDGDCIFSTDTYRVSIYELPEEDKSLSFAIPGPQSEVLRDYDIVGYCLLENWLVLETADGAIIGTTLSKAEPFDWEKSFEDFDEDEASNIRIPKEVKDAVDSISFMTDIDVKKDQVVEVELTEGFLTLRMKKESGTIEKTVEVKYKGQDVKFSMVPEFFSQILSHATVAKIGKSSAIFKSHGFTHNMLLPMEE